MEDQQPLAVQHVRHGRLKKKVKASWTNATTLAINKQSQTIRSVIVIKSALFLHNTF